MFAYFHENKHGRIDKKVLDEYIGMYIQCGKISYKEMINKDNYDIVFGVSGTLEVIN